MKTLTQEATVKGYAPDEYYVTANNEIVLAMDTEVFLTETEIKEIVIESKKPYFDFTPDELTIVPVNKLFVRGEYYVFGFSKTLKTVFVEGYEGDCIDSYIDSVITFSEIVFCEKAISEVELKEIALSQYFYVNSQIFVENKISPNIEKFNWTIKNCADDEF